MWITVRYYTIVPIPFDTLYLRAPKSWRMASLICFTQPNQKIKVLKKLTRNTGTVHTSSKARLTLTAVWRISMNECPLTIFSERELKFTFAICYHPSVCRLSVCLLSVTFARPTQAVQIFGNISTALGTLAIHWHHGACPRGTPPPGELYTYKGLVPLWNVGFPLTTLEWAQSDSPGM